MVRRAALAAMMVVLLAAGARSANEQPDPDSNVPEISTQELAAILASRDPPVLFDVREQIEFDVSHIERAIRLEPSLPPEELRVLVRHAAGMRAVIFYCTFGPRSAEVALAIHDDLIADGVKQIAVLAGGLIAWHNEGRRLVDGRGETQFLHPHDEEHQKLMLRGELARYSPRG